MQQSAWDTYRDALLSVGEPSGEMIEDHSKSFYYRDEDWIQQKHSEGLRLYSQEQEKIMFEACEKLNEALRWFEDAKRQIFISEAKDEIKATKPKEYKLKLVALTICPDRGDHNTMLEIMEIVKDTSCMKTGGKFVIEQRSKVGEDPYGWHIHLVVNTTYAPSRIKQYVQQRLASRGYVATYYATPADSRWEKKYMAGDKGNADKALKVKKDKILREQLGLQNMYVWELKNE